MNLERFKAGVDDLLTRVGDSLTLKQKELVRNSAQSIFDQANVEKQTDGSEELLNQNELTNAKNLLTKLVYNLLTNATDNTVEPEQAKETPEVEVEPVVISNLTNVDSKTKEYLDKDTTYQSYIEGYSQLKTEMKKIENKYGIQMGDNPMQNIREELKIDDSADSKKYSAYSLRNKSLTRQLENYEKEMSNWQDGPYMSFFRRGSVSFNNVERITLKNGERAWKSNEGVFYPYFDGGIGGKRVPEELLQ